MLIPEWPTWVLQPIWGRTVLSPEELRKLRRHHNATIGLFVAFWICVVGVILAIELLDLSKSTETNLMGAILAAVIVLGLLQFSKRCPECGTNLGWQVRLGIPDRCRKCGVALKADKDV